MIKKLLLATFPDLWYLIRYYKSKKLMGDKSQQRDEHFDRFVQLSSELKCLQIGVRDRKYADHWVSVDLFDHSPLIDYNYDIHDLKFKKSTFDRVACKAILEHVEDPWKAVSEMHRVLKKNGEIWVEIPFNQPYHPSPQDYWRVTPEGMLKLLSDFECIESGLFSINKSSIYNGIFFHGRKIN